MMGHNRPQQPIRYAARPMRIPTFSILVAAAMLATACSQSGVESTQPLPTSEPYHSHLNATTAVELAIQEVRRLRHDVEQYESPVVKFSWHGSEATWHITFWGRNPMPGNHISVDIRDRDGSAILHPGR